MRLQSILYRLLTVHPWFITGSIVAFFVFCSDCIICLPLNIRLYGLYVIQTHHMQCPAEPRMFPSIDCNTFNHAKPKTMALSVLVVIEMSNALNR